MAINSNRVRFDFTTAIAQPNIQRIDFIDFKDQDELLQYVIPVWVNSSSANGRGVLFKLKVNNGVSYGLMQNPAPTSWDDTFKSFQLSTPSGYTSLDAAIVAAGTGKGARHTAGATWLKNNGLLLDASSVALVGTVV